MLGPGTASFSVRWKTWESTCAGVGRGRERPGEAGRAQEPSVSSKLLPPEFSKAPRALPQGPRKFSNFAPRIEYNRITRSRRLISRNSKIIPRAIPTRPFFYLRQSQRGPPLFFLFFFLALFFSMEHLAERASDRAKSRIPTEIEFPTTAAFPPFPFLRRALARARFCNRATSRPRASLPCILIAAFYHLYRRIV